MRWGSPHVPHVCVTSVVTVTSSGVTSGNTVTLGVTCVTGRVTRALLSDSPLEA
jgi:hypothetical protein